MANDFRAQIGGYRASAMQNAMATMAGSSFDAVTSQGLQSGLDNRQRAIEKASAWTNRGISAVGGMGDFMNDMAGQAMQQGLQAKTSDAIHQEQMKAARAAQSANGHSGALGIASSVAGLFLCERRLKQGIESLAPDNAWSVVRDLPYYSFEYKAAPGRTAYGPMIDEVEQLDPSLVRPTLLPPDEEGPVRGFDVMRHQAYETIALQQALQRIEQLEARLARLEAPVAAPAAWRQPVTIAA